IHMGYNYLGEANGAHHIIHADEATSRISTGPGFIALATGGINQVPVNRLSISGNGDIGIGTQAPIAKLDVRGDIRLGIGSEFFAPGCEENLRMIIGNVDDNGTIDNGAGFTSQRIDTGDYVIQFSTPFADV